MEGVALEHFKKLKPSTIPMAKFNSSLSDESDQDASTTATNICTLLQFIFAKHMISPLLTMMWYKMNGCANQYRCALDLYLLSFLVYNVILLLKEK